MNQSEPNFFNLHDFHSQLSYSDPDQYSDSDSHKSQDSLYEKEFASYQDLNSTESSDNGQSPALAQASETIRNDFSLVLQSVQTDGMSLQFASDPLKKNETIVYTAIQNNELAIKFASYHLLLNKKFMLKLLEINVYLILQAPTVLLDDYTFVKEAVKINGLVLEFVNSRFRDDYRIMSNAVGQCGLHLKLASLRLRDNPALVLIAVQNEGISLRFASKRMQRDKLVVSYAVRNNGFALEFAAFQMKNDEQIVFTALISQPRAFFQCAPTKIKDNCDFLYRVVKYKPSFVKFLRENQEISQEMTDKILEINPFCIRYFREITGNTRILYAYLKLFPILQFLYDYAKIQSIFDLLCLADYPEYELQPNKKQENEILVDKPKNITIKGKKFILGPIFNDKKKAISIIGQRLQGIDQSVF